ncbi:MAG: SDR family oxidoreductase [Bacteroidia bacterium]|nr:SDR family oxidoreductase [Bacteroidia bacterium]
MKTIVITGASRGIGFDAALKLCKEGHRVIAVARSERGLEKLYNELSRFGKADLLIPVQGDLEKESSINQIADRISTITNSIDVLINNAGTLVNKPFIEISREELEHVYAVNVFAVFGFTQKLLPLLQTSQQAHIINITSVGGLTGTAKFSGLSAYSSSKAALSVFTEVLAEELKDSRIRVNGLALGAVQTEMLSAAFPGYQAPITSEGMAGFVTWFALNGGNYFHGKLLPVALTTP